MDSKTYIAGAIRTESVPKQLHVNEIALHAALEMAIAAGKVLDQFKRRLYYSKPEKEVLLDANVLGENLGCIFAMAQYLGANVQAGADLNQRMDPAALTEAVKDLPDEIRNFQLDNLNVRLLHAGLGCFTESGELLESLKKQYETGVLDKTNFGEEVGDVEWYQAIGFDESGVSEADCREKNIAKLKARYPDKFDAVAAVNRDLDAERAILEAPAAQ